MDKAKGAFGLRADEAPHVRGFFGRSGRRSRRSLLQVTHARFVQRQRSSVGGPRFRMHACNLQLPRSACRTSKASDHLIQRRHGSRGGTLSRAADY